MDLFPWGLWPGGSLLRGGGVSVQERLCPGGGLCQGDPLYGDVRAVRILLECILLCEVAPFWLVNLILFSNSSTTSRFERFQP